MNFEALKDVVASKAARQVLLTQKHSPKILFAVGVTAVVGGAVMACRATLQLEEVLDKAEANAGRLVKIRNNAAYGKTEEELAELDKLAVHSKAKVALDIAKLYAPAVALGLIGIGALTGSHVVLSKRNTSVLAAYAALDRAYKQYRQNVVEEFGVDTDRKFVVGTENIETQERMADGKTKVDTKTVVTGKKGASPYAVCFDESSGKFTREPGMNPVVVGMMQQWANDKLRSRGHLFLNEVLDMLELPRTKAGAVVGWVYRNDSEPKTGDNYVSFGAWDNEDEQTESFIAGHEKAIWLDFNVDGVILDLI